MRSRVVLLTLVLVAASGCLADDPDGSVQDVVDALSPVWQEALLVAPGADAESSLHIDGDVWLLCTHGGFWQASPVWASTDGGETFELQTIEPNPIVSGDCDVDTLDDGSWVVVYDTIASATVAVSRDQGASWSLNYLSALPIKVDRPWLATEGDTIVMVYANVMAAEPALGIVATSDDHGLTWSHEVYALFESTDRPNHIHGDIVVSDDAWRVPVGRADFNLGMGEGTALDVYTQTGGSAWVRSPVATTDRTFILPSLAEDGQGTLYYVVPRGTADGTLDLHVAWSVDRGVSWTESAPVASGQSMPGVVGPWIDGRPDGGATIAWRSVDDTGVSIRAVQLTLVEDDIVAGPVSDLFASDHRPGQIYEFLMVDHDASGTPHVLFVHDDGSGCDPAPNPAESRGSQCLWLVRAD